MSLEERLKERIKALQGELNSLDQRKRELHIKIEELNYLLNEEKTESKTSLHRGAPVRVQENGKDKSDNIRELIVTVLDESPEQYFKASQLSSELLRQGTKSTSKDFTHLIRTTLNYLRKNNKVKSIAGESNVILYTSLKNKNSGGMFGKENSVENRN